MLNLCLTVCKASRCTLKTNASKHIREADSKHGDSIFRVLLKRSCIKATTKEDDWKKSKLCPTVLKISKHLQLPCRPLIRWFMFSQFLELQRKNVFFPKPVSNILLIWFWWLNVIIVFCSFITPATYAFVTMATESTHIWQIVILVLIALVPI